MPLNPSGAISLGGPTVGQSIAVELGLSPTATISLNQTNVRTLAGVPSGAIIMPTNFYGKSNIVRPQRAIFGFGQGAGPSFTSTNVTNLVSNTGVMAANTPGVGTAKNGTASATYGTDKAIFGFGITGSPSFTAQSITNLVSNTGVMAANTPGVGTARFNLGAVSYGSSGQAMFAFGNTLPTVVSTVNLVSNTGVVAANTPSVGPIRSEISGASYGADRAIFIFGNTANPPAAPNFSNIINLVSNAGVIASQTSTSGTARRQVAAVTYGSDKAIFAYGRTPPSYATNFLNLVSNTGVVGAQFTATGTVLASSRSGATYGGDRGIFAFGSPTPSGVISTTNLVANNGFINADVPGVPGVTARAFLSGAGYSV